MIGAGNAMGMFEAGKQGGQARGLSGIGGAIRGMLQQANKKGLIQQQAMGNAQASVAATQAKNIFGQQQANAAGPQPDPRTFRDPETGKTMVENTTYDDATGQWVKKISPASFNLIEKVMGGGASAADGGSDINSLIPALLQNMTQ